MQVDLATAQELFSEIESLDEVIAAASGSTEAGKRAIANQIAAETESEYSKTVSQVVSAITKIEDEKVQVGLFTALQTALKKNFGEAVETYLNKEVEARKTDTPSVSPEELEKAVTDRKELVNRFKALKNLLDMWGEDTSVLGEIKQWRGPRGPQGKRGPRLPKNLQLSIDGKDRSATQNSLSSIAATVCKGEGFESDWSANDLRTWLGEQGFDFENVPATFEYTLPNGKVLAGRLTDDVADDDDDENEDETEE